MTSPPPAPRDVLDRRCCTNRDWPARCQSTGSSPADAIRHWSAEGGHPIEDLTAEDGLTPLPSWAPGAKAISDDGLVAEERVLHPALTMVPTRRSSCNNADGDRVIGGVSGDAHERALDCGEQIEGGGRIITHRLGQRVDTDHAGLIDAKMELPPATPAALLHESSLGNQTPVPAEHRVRRDDACHLTQDPPAEFLASHRESPALGVGQTKRSRTKMLPEDAILLPEIVDAIFLVASHPASQGQPEEVQSVGHGRRLHGSDTAVTHVVSGIHSPRPFSRTIRHPCSVAPTKGHEKYGPNHPTRSGSSCNNAGPRPAVPPARGRHTASRGRAFLSCPLHARMDDE